MGSRSRRERAAGLCRVRATSQSHQRAQIGTTSLSELRRISEARGIDYTAVDAALPELTLHFSGTSAHDAASRRGAYGGNASRGVITIDSPTPPPGAASGFALPLKQNPYHQTPRETTNDHRSCSKAKDLPQADGQKRRPGCSRTPWHRGCPVKAAQRRRWHDTRKDDDTKTTAVRDGPHEYRPHSLHYHLSSPTSD